MEQQQVKKKKKPRNRSRRKTDKGDQSTLDEMSENNKTTGEEDGNENENEKEGASTRDNNNNEDKKEKKRKERKRSRNRKKQDDKEKKVNREEPSSSSSSLQSNQKNSQIIDDQTYSIPSTSASIINPIYDQADKHDNNTIPHQRNHIENKENKPLKKNAIFSFTQRRKRIIDTKSLPTEEVQYDTLRTYESKDSVKPSFSSTSSSDTVTPTAVSTSSTLLKKDHKNKQVSSSLSSSSQLNLDPKFSLSNYFVPATKIETKDTTPLSLPPKTDGYLEVKSKSNAAISTSTSSGRLSKDMNKTKPKESTIAPKESKSTPKESKLISKESKRKSKEINKNTSKEPKESKNKGKEAKNKSKVEESIQHHRQENHTDSKQNKSVKVILEKKDDNYKKSEYTKKKDDKREAKQQQMQVKQQEPKKYIHSDDKLTGRRPRYSPYLDPDIIQKGLDNDTIYQGVLRINKRNRADSFVTSDGLEHDIYIEGLRDRNRALEGDLVAVRLLNVETIWQRKKNKQQQKNNNNNSQQQQHDDKKSNTGIEIGVRQLEETEENDGDYEDDDVDKNKPKFCGEVVGIIHRIEKQQVTGTLHINRPQGKAADTKQTNNKNNNDDSQSEEETESDMTPNYNHVKLVWLKPTDKRAPFIAIPVAHAPKDFLTNEEKYKDEIFVGQYVRWPIDSQFPFGKLVRELGPIGDMNVEAQSILADSNIYDGAFSNKALQCLPKTPWQIPKKEYDIRRDLRNHRVFSIDPETAKDLDDALHVTQLEDGNFEVGVHIADVSYFLKQFTQLDHEAKDRATSTYLVDRVIPMLPTLLCEELCSLNPNVERLAFSVIWKMDEYGNVLDTWFGRTIIKSCAKLSYQHAQSVIEGNGLPSSAGVINHSFNDVEKDIMILYKLSLHMRKRRFDNGALSMNSIRLTFKLDDSGEPVGVDVYEQKDSNRLIEEFMLRANISVAEKICDHYPNEALLRRHEYPIPRRLVEFIETVEEMGYKIDGRSSETLQASFNAIESEDVKTVLLILAIKPMRRAKYFCAGSFEDSDKYLHFALNIPMYTHFTSPIRRYADVVVHRQLEAILKKERKSCYSKKQVQAIALQCNRKKDHAKLAQEKSSQLYLSRYLYRLSQTDGPIIRSAIILQVGPDAFDLLVPEYGLESRIYVDAIPFESFVYHPQEPALYVYWKKDEIVNMETVSDIRQQNKDRFNKDRNKDNNNNDTIDNNNSNDNNNEASSTQALTDNLPKSNLDQATRLQQFKTFERFNVLIQVNMDRTPPFINIYPVNPFYNK
ncbi:unnamed protein product [Cunninghamella echinulata]